MRILIVIGFMLFAGLANAQNPPPPSGVNQAAWNHLMTEVDKGGDSDDPGKMIRFWMKANSGSLSQIEKTTLESLANRHPKRGFGPDKDVYMSMMAAMLLDLNASKQAQAAKNAETDRHIAELKKSLDELKKMLENKTATLTVR